MKSGTLKKYKKKICIRLFLLWLPLLFSLFLFRACAPPLDTIEPPIEAPAEFSNSGTEIIPEKWWISFNDPSLNVLVEKALSANLNLASFWQQFQAALAVIQREASFLYPEVNATAFSEINRPEQDFSEMKNVQLGLTASYELDLWGRIRAAVQAEEFRAQASYHDYEAAAMTLSAETAITWYELVAARKQLKLINEQIEVNRNISKLIRARFASGQIRAVDILRQEQLLESTRAQKVDYEMQIAILKNQLAVLLGRPPQNDLDLPEYNFPEIPPLPATGLPLELVRRRPDVQRAYNLVLAADREMAEAIRSKYPRISVDLAAQIGNSGASLFQNWAYSLAGNLVAPLFAGGRLSAEVERSEAIKYQRLFQYGQTVLNAFEEVENALIREQKQMERLEVLQRQLELAEKTNKQLRLSFLNGLTDYLDVLLSLEQEQELQRELIEAKQAQLEIRIALYRALAGGFETDPLIPQNEDL